MAALRFWRTDGVGLRLASMDPDEIFVAVVSLLALGAGVQSTSTARLHRLYLRRAAAGIGLNRLATVLAMGWLLVVLMHFADPSVRGSYVWFYLLIGCAVVKTAGPLGARLFGVRFRVDVCERGNPAAGLFHAGFVLATGIIFGACLVGEADPAGHDEGGWWIPLGFFAAGWGTLLLALGLFFWREPGPPWRNLRRDRNRPEAVAGGAYALASAWVLAGAVAGDFYGWRHGLLAVGCIGVMLGARELFAWGQDRMTVLAGGSLRTRTWESVTYLASGVVFWLVNRSLEDWLAGLT
jgi:hypothetical protein